MDPKIRVLNNAEIVVSPQCHTHFYRNMWFYEHGFRSAGMFMYPPTLEYGTSALIEFDLPRHCMLIEVPYYPFKTRMQSRL